MNLGEMSEPTAMQLMAPEQVLEFEGIKVTIKPLTIRQATLGLKAFLRITKELSSRFVVYQEIDNADGTKGVEYKTRDGISFSDVNDATMLVIEECESLLSFCINVDPDKLPSWALYDLVGVFVEQNFHKKAIERFLALSNRLSSFVGSVMMELQDLMNSQSGSSVVVTKNEDSVPLSNS